MYSPFDQGIPFCRAARFDKTNRNHAVMSAVPAPARTRARQPQPAPSAAVYGTLIDDRGRWITPIQSYEDRERRNLDYLAQRDVIPDTPAPDAGPNVTNAFRCALANRIKDAILDQDAIPHRSRAKEAYKHLFGGERNGEKPRWKDAEIEDLSWQLVELGEYAALGECHIPDYHEKRRTPYAQYQSLEARVAAVIDVLRVKKSLVASCFRDKAFSARLMWNPKKEVGTSEVNDGINARRQRDTQLRRQSEQAVSQQNVSQQKDVEEEEDHGNELIRTSRPLPRFLLLRLPRSASDTAKDHSLRFEKLDLAFPQPIQPDATTAKDHSLHHKQLDLALRQLDHLALVLTTAKHIDLLATAREACKLSRVTADLYRVSLLGAWDYISL
ncbi:hypothetical protein GGR57DRAFT_503981 [Xylariaceae sp. FL1272]|nr:hypothetical protein GGR57DRAFT_503981 [Xylariaceae sp. FL1272]